MAIQQRAGNPGLKPVDKLLNIMKAHKKIAYMVAAAAGGGVMAGSRLFGGVSPFGAAFAASLEAPYAMAAAVGAIIGYTFSANPLANMKYLAAVAVVAAIKWLFGGKGSGRFKNISGALIAFVALGASGAAMMTVSGATLYDAMLTAAEVFLGAGAAYFFSRTLLTARSGWENAARSDISCMIVSFSVVIMGFSGIYISGLSIGRMLSVLIILLAARSAGEAGGAVAGITAGIAMGLSGGDYSYAIAAYGFGGLLAGVFGGLGRISTAAAFIAVNTVSALFTKTGAEVYYALFEIFAASVVFIAIPNSAVAGLRMMRLDRAMESEQSAQSALKSRISELSGALREIGSATNEVSRRLGKLETRNLSAVTDRVVERVCTHCGMKTTCWQFRLDDSSRAIKDILFILRREGTINKARMPKYFADSCCKLDDFTCELNTQFSAHVAREGVQRKVARVREAVIGQFDSLAMMLDDVASGLCGVTLLDAPRHRRVREYFERGGFDVRQIRCYTGEHGRVTAEVTIPDYEAPKLAHAKSSLDLSALLETDLDMPGIMKSEQSATIVYNEKAAFTAETGVYQIAPEDNRICGDAYETIPNRAGKAHFIISDGMGSGGGAAVESHMASGLLAKLISVGFTHEAALKMVNSALLVKSGEESLATIDICSLDLYTGRADFYKAGAAPTFIIRGGKVISIESTSLPAGILQGVAFDQSGITLREGDVIVMLSDGVVATGSDWIRSELLSIGSDDIQRLAEKLAMTSKIRRTDSHEDDITVLAVALRKGV